MTKAAHLIAATALALAATAPTAVAAEGVPGALRQRSALPIKDGISSSSAAPGSVRRARQAAVNNNSLTTAADDNDVSSPNSPEEQRSLTWVQDFLGQFGKKCTLNQKTGRYRGRDCPPGINDRSSGDEPDPGEPEPKFETLPPATSPPTIKPTPYVRPTKSPTPSPTLSPTMTPTNLPTAGPTAGPTVGPSESPSMSPSDLQGEVPETSTTTTSTTTTTTIATCYPAVEEDGSTISTPVACKCDADYPIWMGNNPNGFIFDTMEGCCEAKGCPSESPTLSPTDEPTNSPSISPTTTISPSSAPTPLPFKWFTKIHIDGSQICSNGTDYPQPWYSDPNFLFDTELECCAAFTDVTNINCQTLSPTTTPSLNPTTTLLPTVSSVPSLAPTRGAHCGQGEAGLDTEFWYPHTLEDGGHLCANDADYPDNYYLMDSLCKQLLFATEDECCHFYPTACVETTSGGKSIGEMWYPDMSTVNVVNETLECVHGDAYPVHYTMNAWAETHLFDTYDECCSEWDCHLSLEDYYYPMLGEESDLFNCEFGKGYPMSYLESPEDHLFNTMEECEATWVVQAASPNDTTVGPTGSPTNRATGPTGKVIYAYPNFITNDRCIMDDQWYDFWAGELTILFNTMEECCEAKGYDCTTDGPTSTPTVSPTPRATGPTGKVIYAYPKFATENCVMDDQYSEDWVGQTSLIFDTVEECCTLYSWTCPTTSSSTPSASPTLVVVAPKQDSGTEGPTGSPTVGPTGSPTNRATGPTGKVIWAYPREMDGDNKCRMDDLWPDYYGNSPTNRLHYLFDTLEDCCVAKNWSCSASPTKSPSLVPSKSPTKSPSDSPSKNPTNSPTSSPTDGPSILPSASPTDGPLRNYWYPDIHGEGNSCIFDFNYPWWMTTEEYRASQLFETKAACCFEHSCDPISDDFESEMESAAWVHGGTTTHVADWRVTSHKFVSGSHSLRSGDLNGNLSKSSDVSLAVWANEDSLLKFSYLSDVMELFDRFELQVDGQVKLEVVETGNWTDYEIPIESGEHDISFHVISADQNMSFSRSIDLAVFGTGVFYVDDLEVIPV